MKAIVYTKYGAPDVRQFIEITKPAPRENEVLVKVHAASVNKLDCFLVRGEPFLARIFFGLLKPKYPIPGADFAGRVEAVGRNVKQFEPGDEVFGDLFSYGLGAFAEYVSVPETAVALKPASDIEEAVTVPVAAVTALQGLRDKGRIQPGQRSHSWGVWRRGYICGADCQSIRGRNHCCVQHEECGHGALDWGRPCH